MPENRLVVNTAMYNSEHPEDYCHRCGGPNISWYAPNDVWNAVMRPDGEGSEKWGIICPVCFYELFDEMFPQSTFVVWPDENTIGGSVWALQQITTAQDLVEQALRTAAEKWLPLVPGMKCPTCQVGSRETRGLVCQVCGFDYGKT